MVIDVDVIISSVTFFSHYIMVQGYVRSESFPRHYHVVIFVKDDKIVKGSCECLDFIHHGGICKHMWKLFYTFKRKAKETYINEILKTVKR